MFLLDTNVVSEVLDQTPDPSVERWYKKQRTSDLYFSAVGEYELRYGLATMRTGKRQRALAFEIETILSHYFKGRILPFDSSAARECADIEATNRLAGLNTELADCQIAAIARARNMTLVTRNVKDFKDTGLEVINPWEEG